MAASDPTAYGSSWYAAGAVAVPARAPLNGELDVDVCVVGGGLAGLTAARETARRGWSVVVLEARRIAGAASGRNTGFVLPGFASDAETLIARVGRDRARGLWALSESGVEYVRRTIRETAMPGAELSGHGWLHVSKTGDDGIAAYADLLAREFGVAVDYWPAEVVRASLRSPLYFGAVHYKSAFTINPLNYALGLAAAAESVGVRIFEDTPAIELDPAGVRKRVATPMGRVRAAQVVLAGNVEIGGLMPRIARTLIPISTYVITTAPLGDALREAIAYRGAVSDTELANNHYRVVGGDRLMWSGRSTVWRGNPRRYAAALLADIERAYPQLGKVAAECAWTGTLGNAVHRMPQIGELSPGVWLLSGFGGHGLNTTAMGGDIVARGIVDGDQTWRQFLPFELVPAGGVLGRAATQIYSWSFMARERFDGWLARRRKGTAPLTSPVPAAPSVVPADTESLPGGPVETLAPPRRRKRQKAKNAAESGGGPAALEALESPVSEPASSSGKPPPGRI